MSRLVATARVYTLPHQDYYLDMGHCEGCLAPDTTTQLDPSSHTCGYLAPPDGLVISIRQRTGEYANDVLDLEALPF